MNRFSDNFQLIVLIGIPLLFSIIERLIPAVSVNEKNRLSRWPANYGLGLLNIFVSASIAVLMPVSMAVICEQNKIGVFNFWPIPILYEIMFVVLARTFIQYIFHRSLHKYELLWRVHKAHHSDHFLDTSSSFRFHPLELIMSRLIQIPVIIIMGFSATSIAWVEILQMIGSIATHANFRLHPKLEGMMRIIFVTPALHRHHHSKNIHESATNFGDLLVIWDKLFCTLYSPSHKKAAPDKYGVDGLDQSSLITLIEMPFRK